MSCGGPKQALHDRVLLEAGGFLEFEINLFRGSAMTTSSPSAMFWSCDLVKTASIIVRYKTLLKMRKKTTDPLY